MQPGRSDANELWKSRLDDLLELEPAVLWEAAPESEGFLWVQGGLNILGFPAAQWTNASDFWASRLHPDDAVEAIQFRANVAGSRKSRQTHYRMLTSEGQAVWFRDSARLTDSGVLRGVLTRIPDPSEPDREKAGGAVSGGFLLDLEAFLRRNRPPAKALLVGMIMMRRREFIQARYGISVLNNLQLLYEQHLVTSLPVCFDVFATRELGYVVVAEAVAGNKALPDLKRLVGSSHIMPVEAPGRTALVNLTVDLKIFTSTPDEDVSEIARQLTQACRESDSGVRLA